MSVQTHHSIEIPERNLKLFIPKMLQHCNSQEYAAMAMLIYKWQTGQIHYQDLLVHAAYKLLNLEPTKRKQTQLDEDCMYSNIALIAESCIPTFFNQEAEGKVSLKFGYTHNHTPWVLPFSQKVYGPTARFENMCWGQYEDGLNLYLLYHKFKKRELLFMLMATFYWPQKKEYNQKLVEARAKSFEQIDFGQVYGFFLFFSSFQLYLTTTKIVWEGKTIDLSLLFSDSDKDDEGFVSEIPGLGMKSLTFQMAETGVFGTVQEMRKQDFWPVMLHLYDLRKRDLDAKAKEELLKSKNNGKN